MTWTWDKGDTSIGMRAFSGKAPSTRTVILNTLYQGTRCKSLAARMALYRTTRTRTAGGIKDAPFNKEAPDFIQAQVIGGEYNIC